MATARTTRVPAQASNPGAHFPSDHLRPVPRIAIPERPQQNDHSSPRKRVEWAADGTERRRRIEPAFEGIVQRMLAEMARKGISKREMSLRMGSQSNNAYRWFRGRRTPDALSVALIADVLGCSADYLLGLTGERGQAKVVTDLAGRG